MGQFMGTALSTNVGLKMNDKATFPPDKGFKFKRAKRTPVAKEDDLKSARIPLPFRDYCANLLLDYQVCRYKHMPFLYRCGHVKHAYLQCEQKDYILRMKEFERERRLRLREKRIKEQKCDEPPQK